MKSTTSEEVLHIVRAIHDTPGRAVVAVAGGGASALTWLLGSAGSSRTVLEALSANSPAAMEEFIGYRPRQFVCRKTALDMAQAAYRRAARLREDAIPVTGIGCTASLATSRPKKGEHRCHVAAWWATGAATACLHLSKGRRDRAGEDDLVSRLLVRQLAKASGAACKPALPLAECEEVAEDGWSYPDPIAAAVAGHLRRVVVRADGSAADDRLVNRAILAGSFNPLHDGHRRLARAASETLGLPVAFELSVTNVDKSALEESEVRRRIAQFEGYGQVVLTRATVFVQKARLLPGCTFVIGADTAMRLVDAKYYQGPSHAVLDALAEIRLLGCRFLVAGRLAAGGYLTLRDVPVPGGFADLFDAIPESRFRYDVSSTELRGVAVRS